MLSYNYVNEMKLYLKILSTTLSLVFLSHEALAGTTMQNLSKTIAYVELDKVAEQKREAQEASQKALSKDDIAKLKYKAAEVKRNADKASSPAERLTYITSRINDKAFVVNELKRWKSDLILEEVDFGVDRTQLIMAIDSDLRDYLNGAMVQCSSEVIE